MKEHAIYFVKRDYFDLIRKLGGEWADRKMRPVVCLIKLKENDDIFWAIPMGNYKHRDEPAKKRLQKYLELEESDIRSCFYHLGKTDKQSIFFISDAFPVTDDYIEREYISAQSCRQYIIKNRKLLKELERKLERILYWEDANNNYFRQNITNLKDYLLEEKRKNI